MIGKVISHYKILEKLGEGGMGVVYKAEDSRLHRPVALKFLPPDLMKDEEAKSRFIFEAQTASALDHPNIGTVYEIDETDDGQAFICMAFYPGETLKAKINRGPIGIDASIEIAIQIAEGLRRAHAAGIVHRDIKPANILVTDEGVVKIVDFGLAKLDVDTRSSSSGRMAGTASYMSPEQAQGFNTDRRSDLFSLGTVLYEMITGKRPFEGAHEAAIFYSILHVDPTPPSKLRRETPLALESVISSLLQKDPARRYQSADTMLADMRSLKLGFGISSTSWKRRVLATMRSRRRMVPAYLGGALIIGLALWITVGRIAHPSYRYNSSAYVLVADFQNLTADKRFNHSMTEAMTVGLRQSPHLNVFPSYRVPEVLERMQLPPDQLLDEATALSLARRSGVQVLVASSISEAGTGYTLTSQIIDVHSGEVLKFIHRDARAHSEVLSTLDEMCKDIREWFGESLSQISSTTIPLEQATTPSLQALEWHSRAVRLEAQGNYHDAAVLEEQAVAEDSLFAMATSDLSYMHRKLGNDSLALYYHLRVLPLITRVTERERLSILTVYYGPNFELDYRKARESAQKLVVLYPNDVEGLITLGWFEMYIGNTQFAVEAFQRSLAIDSTEMAVGILYNNWGFSLALGGDGNGALPFYRRSKSLRPAYYGIDLYMSQAHWMTGELDSAESILLAIPPEAGIPQRISACIQLAALYEFQGKHKAARKQCLEGISICRKEERPGDEAYFHYLLGELAAEESQWSVYEKEMTESVTLTRSPYTELPLVGISYARNNRSDGSKRILGRIGSIATADPYFMKRRQDYVHLVNGELLLQRNKPDEAVQEFRRVERIHNGDPLFLIAQSGIARSSVVSTDTAAFNQYEDLLLHKGEAVMGWVRTIRTGGFWTRELWPEVELELGKLCVQRKDTTLAMDHLKRCLKFWSNADAGDRRSGEARAILTQLTKGR